MNRPNRNLRTELDTVRESDSVVRNVLRSFGPLFLVTLMGCALLSGYELADHSPPLIFELWGNVFWLSAVTWIQTDAQLRRQTPCFDFGWLVWMTAGVSIPWYLLRTRGSRGLLILLMFLFLLVLPHFAATIVGMIRDGRPG